MIAFVRESCFNAVMEILEGHTILDRCVYKEQDINTYTVFNMASMINAGHYVPNLIPPVMVGQELLKFDDEKSFDILYAQYLVNDDAGFVDMFKIINNLYLGGNSIVLIADEGNVNKDVLVDSFIKFIQQRYGISPIRIINEREDWYSYDEDGNFNLSGVYNMDIDKERYAKLTTDFIALADELEEM